MNTKTSLEKKIEKEFARLYAPSGRFEGMTRDEALANFAYFKAGFEFGINLRSTKKK